MSTHPLRPVTCHNADDQPADYRYNDDERAKMVADRGNHVRSKTLIKEYVGKQADQLQQRERDEGAKSADTESKRGDRQQSWSCSEVTEIRMMFCYWCDVLH